MVSCHYFSSGSRNHSSLFLHTWTSDTSSHSAALRLLNWEKEKERWTKVLASKSLRTLEGVEEEEVNEEADDDKKEERMVWPTA